MNRMPTLLLATVLLSGCSLQVGEVAEVTAEDAVQTPSAPTTGGVVYTQCQAHVPYTVDGQTLSALDTSMLVTPGQSAENCPFEVGQSALVWVGSTPQSTRVFTTSGRTWWLFGGLLLFPLLGIGRMVAGRSKE